MSEPGLHFDRVASTYRHARPGYPAEVYDLLSAHGAIGPGLRVPRSRRACGHGSPKTG